MASHDLELIFLQFWGASPDDAAETRAPNATRLARGRARTIDCVGCGAVLPALIAGCCTLAAAAPPPSAAEAHAFAVSLAHAGPRPAGSAAERRAHQRVAARFRAAGLRVGYRALHRARQGHLARRDRHPRRARALPGHRDGARRQRPARARRRRQRLGRRHDRRPRARRSPTAPAPACDIVARGDRLRGAALHRAARPPRRRGARPAPARTHSLRDVRLALSLDEVGRGTRFELRSPGRKRRAPPSSNRSSTRRGAPNVDVTWLRDSATGNSDHRELALAGAPAAKLGVPDEPCPPHRVRHARPPAARRVRPRAARRVAAAARGQLTAEHPLGQPLGQRDRAQVRVRARDRRHDRGVGDRQALDSRGRGRRRRPPRRSRTCPPDGRSRGRPRARGARRRRSAPGAPRAPRTHGSPRTPPAAAAPRRPRRGRRRRARR